MIVRSRSRSQTLRLALSLFAMLAIGCGEADAPAPDGAEVEPSLEMAPIDPPIPDDCITDVGAGDHTFECGGRHFLVVVPEPCTRRACGLVFDVHGGTMSGAQMRDNTHLDDLAPAKGFIVVHPSATPENTGGTWDLVADPPVIGDFLVRMIDAFHVDERHVHVTGFSQGAAVTFWLLCHMNELLSTAAPISGESAKSITLADGAPCIESIDESWQPRVPILFMSGTADTALVIEDARARVDGLVDRLALTGGDEIEAGEGYRRKRWRGDDGMVLDYIEHDYGGQPLLDGHCIPGGSDIGGAPNNAGVNATTCTTGEITLDWGQVALDWFLEHPRG